MALNEETFRQLVESAETARVRIEMVGGVGVWEAMPGPRHQREIFRIQSSIRRRSDTGSDCGCYHYSDVYVRFPDGSFKRPDISIFCREPAEQDEAVTLIPEAVVEVVSPGYEAKDFQYGIPFYLSHGVKDVVVFDPRTFNIVHARRDGTQSLASPAEIRLECGCVLTA